MFQNERVSIRRGRDRDSEGAMRAGLHQVRQDEEA